MPDLIASVLDDIQSLIRTLRMAGAGSADALANRMLEDLVSLQARLVADGSADAMTLANTIGEYIAAGDAPTAVELIAGLEGIISGAPADRSTTSEEEQVTVADAPALETDLDDEDWSDDDDDYDEDYDDGPMRIVANVALVGGGIVTDTILGEAIAAAQPMITHGTDVLVLNSGDAAEIRTIAIEVDRWAGSFSAEGVKLPVWAGSVHTSAGVATFTGYRTEESAEDLPLADLTVLAARLDELAEESYEARAEWDDEFQRPGIPERFAAAYRLVDGGELTDDQVKVLAEMSTPLLSVQLGTLAVVDTTITSWEAVVTFEVGEPGPLSLEHLGSRFNANWDVTVPGIGRVTSTLRSAAAPVAV